MSELSQLLQAVIIGVVLLLPLANPLTAIAIFLGLSQQMTKQERKQQSLMAAFYVFMIMLVSFYIGNAIMHTFGISIPGLRIAGGLIVAFIGFQMLFPKEENKPAQLELKHKQDEIRKESESSVNIAFVPLAMPATAGPGTIAMIISTATTMYQQADHFSPWVLHVAPVITFLIMAMILWVSLLSASSIMKILGKGGISAISRLMGFLLVCMGVQFVINGIIEIVKNFPTFAA